MKKLKNIFKTTAFLFSIILIINIYTIPNVYASALSNKTLIELTNSERQKYGLNTLQENQELDKAAYAKAGDMFLNQYFAHTSPAGVNSWYWFDKENYYYHYAGENLAINFTDSEDLLTSWMNSPTHRANIIGPNYQDIGMAVVDGNFEGQNTKIVVQMFGAEYQQINQKISKNDENKEFAINDQKPEIAGNQNIEKNEDKINVVNILKWMVLLKLFIVI